MLEGLLERGPELAALVPLQQCLWVGGGEVNEMEGLGKLQGGALCLCFFFCLFLCLCFCRRLCLTLCLHSLALCLLFICSSGPQATLRTTPLRPIWPHLCCVLLPSTGCPGDSWHSRSQGSQVRGQGLKGGGQGG